MLISRFNLFDLQKLSKGYINKMLINNKPNHKNTLDILTLTKLNNPCEARQL